MASDAYRRFANSRIMDYEKWHDGIGYDLDALDELTDIERDSVVSELVGHLGDWRDLEALHRIGTPEALEAIARAQNSSDAQIRLAALRYGTPSAAEVEAALLRSLEPSIASTDTIEAAADCRTPAIREALLRCVRECTGTQAYGAAASLFVMHGQLESVYSWEKRDFLLRFAEPPSPDRDAAYRELCGELGIA